MCWVSQLAQILSNICCLSNIVFFTFAIICESINCHFSNDLWCWTSFQILSGHLHVIFRERSVKVFCLFFNWIVVALLSYKSSLYILDIRLTRYTIYKHFLPFCGLSSHSWQCPLMHKHFNFDKAQFIFCHFSFWCHI
jgi:hypothetical protein